MNKGVITVLYPVKDMAKARNMFRELLGVEPYSDEAYYTGFKVEGQDIGLVPAGENPGATAYYQVDDIQASLKRLVEAGATVTQEARNVGGGRLVAALRDEDGNNIGLIQDPQA